MALRQTYIKKQQSERAFMQGLMGRCLSFFSSSVVKHNKKGIMVEKIVFTKSKFDNLAIGKEFGILLWTRSKILAGL